MNSDRSADYIGHMLEAAQLAHGYIEGLEKADFLADKRTQQAVILNIVVMGEAATKLVRDYPALIEQYPQVPWKSIKGMRNRIAHGYFDINLDIVWDTVRDALPALIETLAAIHLVLKKE
jgi:uncharacterized protein with HEPN domain